MLTFSESWLGVLSRVRVVLLLMGDDGRVPSARTLGYLLVVWPRSLCGFCVCVLWRFQLFLSSMAEWVVPSTTLFTC